MKSIVCTSLLLSALCFGCRQDDGRAELENSVRALAAECSEVKRMAGINDKTISILTKDLLVTRADMHKLSARVDGALHRLDNAIDGLLVMKVNAEATASNVDESPNDIKESLTAISNALAELENKEKEDIANLLMTVQSLKQTGDGRRRVSSDDNLPGCLDISGGVTCKCKAYSTNYGSQYKNTCANCGHKKNQHTLFNE